MIESLGVDLLGPPRATTPDGTVHERMGGPRQLSVLCALALRCREAVPTSWLVDVVWGDTPPTTADNTLQVYVSQLRRTLGRDSIRRASATYVLDLEPNVVDVHRFRRLAVEARDQLDEGHPREARRLATSALELWRGAAFGDLTRSWWLEEEAGRLDDERTAVVATRLEAELRLGGGAAALPAVTAEVAAHPFHEGLQRLHMWALYQEGRQAEALEVCSETRRMLRDELGLDPGFELLDMEERILRQDPALSRARARVEAGMRRPTRLPRPQHLVGRQQERALLANLLQGEDRLICLTGFSGVGKTALAAAVVEDLASAFPVVATVPAEPVTRVLDLIQRLAVALGGRTATAASPEDLAELVDQAARTLVVLDGLEHLLPDAAAMVSALVAQPSVRVLVTSRRPLGLRDERRVPVQPLVTDRDGPATELFWRCVAASGSDLRQDQEAEGVASDICRAVDGVPLAIELAATRTGILALPELRDRLRSSVAVLTDGPASSHGRGEGAGRGVSRSLLGALQATWDACTPAEQALLGALSVMCGSTNLEALEAVSDEWSPQHRGSTLPALAGLVDASLVRVSRDAGVAARYRLLEPVRQFVAERLEAVDLERLRSAHARSFVALLWRDDARALWTTTADLARLRVEEANLLAALVHVRARDPDLFARLVLLISSINHTSVDDNRAWLEAATRLLPDDHPLQPRLLGELSLVLGQLWRLDEAKSVAVSAVECAGACGTDLDRCWTRVNLAMAAADRGDDPPFDRDELAARIDEACRDRGEAGPNGRGRMLGNLGIDALMREEFPAARELFVRARRAARIENDEYSVAANTVNLASICLETGDPELCAELTSQVISRINPSPEARYLYCAGRLVSDDDPTGIVQDLIDACTVIGRYSGPALATPMALIAAISLARLGDTRSAAFLRGVVAAADDGEHSTLSTMDRDLRARCDRLLPTGAAATAARSTGELSDPNQGCLAAAAALATTCVSETVGG